jgi:hypothetical protein
VYGILGEDESDVQTLKVLVKRLANNPSLTVKTKGYGGCGEMLRKGARQLRLFKGLKLERFVVCHDADGPDPEPKRQLVIQKIVKPSGLKNGCCIVVPVQELEAWILADIECAANIFPSWKPSPIDNPEGIPKPKEYVEKLSRDSRQRPRYSHAVHNERMALHLNLKKVAAKCPAFRELMAFVH